MKEPETLCNNEKCFACLKGKCYALDSPEFNTKGECPFFKTVDKVDRTTLRLIYPRMEKQKLHITSYGRSPQFEEQFSKDWNETTIYLLANFRKMISKINITMEL